MAERTTRFDSMVEKEEKKRSDKKENPFERSNQNLKRASDNINMQSGQDENGLESDLKSSTMDEKNPNIMREDDEKALEDIKNMQKKAKESASKRLNISDIIDDTKRVKKKSGRSRTFYMRDSMYDKLASVAEQQGIKPSQLLHIILENVLDKM